jgi:hypothetical protein
MRASCDDLTPRPLPRSHRPEKLPARPPPAPSTAPASAPRSPAPAAPPANAPGLHDGVRILGSIHSGVDLDRLCAVTERKLDAGGEALLASTQDDARLLDALVYSLART